MKATLKTYLHSGQIDITYLLQWVLNKTKTQLYAHQDDSLSPAQQTQLNQLIQKRQQDIPLAYLTQSKAFYHLDFYVNEQVLIPRAQTELLIDITLKLYPDNQKKNVLELATGSGAIAITLADKKPNWHLLASDKFAQAILVAKKNLCLTNHHINLVVSDWFDAIFPGKQFDLIIANPPYIAPDDPHLEALRFEPQHALVALNQGLSDFMTIITHAKHYLKPGGYLLLEHGYNQRQALLSLLGQEFHNRQVFDDLDGVNRAILAQIR